MAISKSFKIRKSVQTATVFYALSYKNRTHKIISQLWPSFWLLLILQYRYQLKQMVLVDTFSVLFHPFFVCISIKSSNNPNSFGPNRTTCTCYSETNEGTINVDAHIMRARRRLEMVSEKGRALCLGQHIVSTDNQLKGYCPILLSCQYYR